MLFRSNIAKTEASRLGTAENPILDPRVRAGSFGEKIKGPHKPTLDEMGPHASLSVPKGSRPLPQKPTLSIRRIEIEEATEKTRRRGRTKKTGRPGN